MAHTILDFSYTTLLFATCMLLGVGAGFPRTAMALSWISKGLSLVVIIGSFIVVIWAKVKFSTDLIPLFGLATALYMIGQVLVRIALLEERMQSKTRH